MVDDGWSALILGYVWRYGLLCHVLGIEGVKDGLDVVAEPVDHHGHLGADIGSRHGPWQAGFSGCGHRSTRTYGVGMAKEMDAKS